MIFHLHIRVMPRPEILDPQGKTVAHGLHELDFQQVRNVRVGKHLELEVEAESAEAAEQLGHEAAKKLLHNPVIEVYEVSAQPAEPA